MAKPKLLHLVQGHEFPDYEYQEFPKWITDAQGLRRVVANKEEEEAAMASAQASLGLKATS